MNHPCTVEEEMSVPLKQLIEKHAGGVIGKALLCTTVDAVTLIMKKCDYHYKLLYVHFQVVGIICWVLFLVVPLLLSFLKSKNIS